MFGLFTAFAGVMVAAGAARHKLLTPSAIKLDKQGLKIRKISGWLDVGLGTMTLLSSTLAKSPFVAVFLLASTLTTVFQVLSVSGQPIQGKTVLVSHCLDQTRACMQSRGVTRRHD